LQTWTPNSQRLPKPLQERNDYEYLSREPPNHRDMFATSGELSPQTGSLLRRYATPRAPYVRVVRYICEQQRQLKVANTPRTFLLPR